MATFNKSALGHLIPLPAVFRNIDESKKEGLLRFFQLIWLGVKNKPSLRVGLLPR